MKLDLKGVASNKPFEGRDPRLVFRDNSAGAVELAAPIPTRAGEAPDWKPKHSDMRNILETAWAWMERA